MRDDEAATAAFENATQVRALFGGTVHARTVERTNIFRSVENFCVIVLIRNSYLSCSCFRNKGTLM